MASTSLLLVFVLCLTLCASSERGLDRLVVSGGKSMAAAADLVTTETHNEEQKQRVHRATYMASHSVASGLTKLIQRMVLFSHALNQTEDELLDSYQGDRVTAGLTGLMQRMMLFSRVLNLSIVAPVHGNSSRQEVREALSDLVDRMTLFSLAVNLSRAEYDGSGINQRAKESLVDLVDRMILFSYALNQSSDGSTQGSDGGEEERVNKGLTDLVNSMTLLSHAVSQSNAEPTGSGDGGEVKKVNKSLRELMHRVVLFSQSLEMHKHKYMGDADGRDDEQRVEEGVVDLAARMNLLSELLKSSVNTDDLDPAVPRELSCLPPFELIAYRMCILQDMHLKLSWDDAQEFCRDRGGKLADDMTVIKTRRFLNDLYGEDGTRSRWPVWVGGRRVDQTWVWGPQQQVPDFLWAPSEPRKFSAPLAPYGECMILDGYRRFYGASLPCHLRRRFVCQLGN